MVGNWVYWRRVSGASKQIFATIKSTIDAVKFQIQYSYLHSNVIMCWIDIYIHIHHICIVPYYWQDDISGNQLKLKKIFNAISTVVLVKITPLNRQLMTWNIQIQFGYLHSNVIMCIATLLTRWRKRQSSKIYHVFNRGIDTMKITALFNHKPGILNNYIRMWFTSLTVTSAGRNM
jgi:hypothetical protein